MRTPDASAKSTPATDNIITILVVSSTSGLVSVSHLAKAVLYLYICDMALEIKRATTPRIYDLRFTVLFDSYIFFILFHISFYYSDNPLYPTNISHLTASILLLIQMESVKSFILYTNFSIFFTFHAVNHFLYYCIITISLRKCSSL